MNGTTPFAFSLIIEGTTEKALQLTMPLKSMDNQNLGLFEQKCIFEHYREYQTIKNLLIDIIFAMKIFFQMTFSELPLIGLCYYCTKMRCSIG